MFGTQADSDQASWNLSQKWKPFQQPKDEWQRIATPGGPASYNVMMNEDLHTLD